MTSKQQNGKVRLFFSHLLYRKSGRLSIQVFRYLAVSAASLAIDFVVLWALTEFAGLHYLLSAIVGYATGLICNYVLSVIWVFHSRKIQSRSAEFAIFVSIGLLGMVVNEGILWLWVDLLGLYYLYGRAVSAVIGYTWKFIARKALLFK
jgi:putative flippase GtrA